MKRFTSSKGELQSKSPVKQAAIGFIVLALFACMTLCLSGCKPPAGQLAANAAIAEMAAIEKHDPESLDYLPQVSGTEQLEQIGISQAEFYSWWLDGFTYSLGDLEMNFDEDAADINAKITCRQLEPIIKQWSNDYVEWLVVNEQAIKAGQTEDPCEYGRLLLQSLFENTEPVLTECIVQVQKIDDEWSVVGSMDNGVYRDALLGSADNLSGYYELPFAQLADLGVKLPVECTAPTQEGQDISEE